MFAKETYIQRRALLKKNIGSGVLLFLGNDEQGLHYEDNTFRYRHHYSSRAQLLEKYCQTFRGQWLIFNNQRSHNQVKLLMVNAH